MIDTPYPMEEDTPYSTVDQNSGVFSRFQMSSMGELTFFLGLQVKQKEDGIFISQDKYVAEILKKFDFASVKTASTPIETQKPLVKDEEASDVSVLVLGCPYLTWKPTQIVTMLEQILDRKSTKGGCQFSGLGDLSPWGTMQKADNCGYFYTQRQNMFADVNVAAVRSTMDVKIKCLDYGAEVIKIHTDHNVADLLTKGFDVTRFNFLVKDFDHGDEFHRVIWVLESLERDIDGTEELLLPDMLILWLTKVSTDNAKLVPLGKDSTAIKPLEKIPPRV
ncbi:putative ribonuclease H-like domain-containing protein [Tanacetum coccineum]